MPTAPRPAYPSLDACAWHELGRLAVSGAAIGILRDGTVETVAYGVASVETRQPVAPDALFQVGSISKVVTATLVMRLVDEGLLDLDAPISHYLPDLRLGDATAPDLVTMRHLLTHTSGLEDRFDDHGWGDDALAKAVAGFATVRQLAPPGERFAYCNTGFTLAGAVIERVLGAGFETAMTDRLFAPLGLERSFFFAHEAIAYPVAVGHTQEPNAAPAVARPYPVPRAVNPAGGIITTAGDLLRFAALHLGDGTIDGTTVLSGASVRAMREPHVRTVDFAEAEAYGLGWALRRAGDASLLGHGGTTNGFQAQLTLVPEHGFAIAVLTNSGRGAGAIRTIEGWALAHYCGLSLEPAPGDRPAARSDRHTRGLSR